MSVGGHPARKRETLFLDTGPGLLNPILKWAGGKRWLVPHILPLWNRQPRRRLVEPFCGGLAMALGLAPRAALLNDINVHLINFYAHVKRGLEIRLEMANDESLYYRSRDRFNALVRSGHWQTSEAAELFYYLNRTGYNGLCRFNSSGEFNVPFGRYKTIRYQRTPANHAAAFQHWDFTSTDFAAIPIESSDFVYADPPYDVQFTRYSKEDFAWSDQVRLVEWLVRHQGPVILSNQATDRILALYESAGFRISVVPAPRRISCTGDRSPANEVIATRGC